MILKGPQGNLDKEFLKLHLKKEPEGGKLTSNLMEQSLNFRYGAKHSSSPGLCVPADLGHFGDFVFSLNWLYHRHNKLRRWRTQTRKWTGRDHRHHVNHHPPSSTQMGKCGPNTCPGPLSKLVAKRGKTEYFFFLFFLNRMSPSSLPPCILTYSSCGFTTVRGCLLGHALPVAVKPSSFQRKEQEARSLIRTELQTELEEKHWEQTGGHYQNLIFPINTFEINYRGVQMTSLNLRYQFYAQSSAQGYSKLLQMQRTRCWTSSVCKALGFKEGPTDFLPHLRKDRPFQRTANPHRNSVCRAHYFQDKVFLVAQFQMRVTWVPK